MKVSSAHSFRNIYLVSQRLCWSDNDLSVSHVSESSARDRDNLQCVCVLWVRGVVGGMGAQREDCGKG